MTYLVYYRTKTGTRYVIAYLAEGPNTALQYWEESFSGTSAEPLYVARLASARIPSPMISVKTEVVKTYHV